MKHDVFSRNASSSKQLNVTRCSILVALVDDMNWNEISSTLYSYKKRLTLSKLFFMEKQELDIFDPLYNPQHHVGHLFYNASN